MKEYIVTNPSQLNNLSVFLLKRDNTIGKLRLIGSISDHMKFHEWEFKLNKYYHACGCDTGAKALIFCFSFGMIWMVFNTFFHQYAIGMSLVAVLALSIIASFIGKYWGIYSAKKKIEALITEIQFQWFLIDSARNDLEKNI